MLLYATTCRDAAGSITGVVGAGQDITDLNNSAAEAKFEAEDLKRRIVTANAPIYGDGLEPKGSDALWILY